MEPLSIMNLVDAVIDEIALEGLDGITLEALWDRMALRFGEKNPPTPQLKEQIWDICLRARQLSFHELEKERAKLIIFDRYKFVDPDLEIIYEPDNVPDDIYEHCPIDDWKNGIKGSCSTYYTRKDISDIVKCLRVDEAEKRYGRKLVIVGSQAARQNALMDKSVCPTLELTVMQHCFLERVGRSRYHGEVARGKLSLSLLKEIPRNLFYYRKFLLRHRLITKQTHHQRIGGLGVSGSLFHLPRFYVERKSKVIFFAEKVIDILKSRKNHMAEYHEIKEKLQFENSIKKLFKTSFFQKIIKTDLRVPWRTLYPQATKAEWQWKHNPAKEKMLRVIQLTNPNVDINDFWKDEVYMDDDDPYELITSEQKYSVPFLKQANAIVESTKDKGLDIKDLTKTMGLPIIHSRSFYRNLTKINIIATYMNTIGRQRKARFVSRKFDSGCQMSTEFQREMSKMKKLTELPLNDKPNEIKNDATSEMSKNSSEFLTIVNNENVKSSKKRKIDTRENDNFSSNSMIETRSCSFDAATKILGKYRLLGCKRKYTKTFRNVAETMENCIIEPKRRKLMNIAKKNNDDLQLNVESKVRETITMKKPDVSSLFETTKSSNQVTSETNIFTNSDLKNSSNVSYRLLKRANLIIETVKKYKVIDDMTKLMKVIMEEEKREGYDVKIYKKSLIRLLQRLAKENFVKNIKLILTGSDKEKSLTFICDPSVDMNHAIIRSAVEQAKVKFCLVGAQKIKTTLQSGMEIMTECTEKTETMDKSSSNDKSPKKPLPSKLVYDKMAGKRYGYAPKFIRIQTLHIFLFYIVYEHPGKPQDSQEKLIEILRTKGVTIDDNLKKNMSDIYNTEIGWKMFVPPLPKHNGWPTGWVLTCNFLHRLPLSIFLKIHKVSYSIPELNDYINDPIRKHLLVKDLPNQLRNSLLIHRKYVHSFHKTMNHMCYFGLLQFGPKKTKEKDKVFVYLNRKTKILDTTVSMSNNRNKEDKIYPAIRYNFKSLETIDKYWYKLWKICVNTRLSERLDVQSKNIILDKKKEMIEAIKPRTPEVACKMDNGHVPGDRKGAAGIDSAFFAHVKRNWNWKSTNPFQRSNEYFNFAGTNFQPEDHIYPTSIEPIDGRFNDFYSLKAIDVPINVGTVKPKKPRVKNSNDNNGGKKKNPSVIATKSKQNRTASTKNVGKSSVKTRQARRVLPENRQARRRVKYDDIDHSALQRMDKLRVDWDNREDNILLVCKVAMTYLCPNSRQQIGFSSVRDILRSYSLTSFNKTSKACHRRLIYMLKKPETRHSVNLGVEELRQNFYVTRRYGNIVEKLRKEYDSNHKYNERINLVFRDLVTYIAKKNYDISEVRTSTLNFKPLTIEEFRFLNHVKYAKSTSNVQGFRDDTINDVHFSTISSVIHSSMCCIKDRRSWAYQLFRIYQQYPEWLLRTAMAKIRTDQMVTIKQNYVFAIRKQSNTCMPMSSSQYQLSSSYVQKFNTKLPYSVFKEAWDFFHKLAKNYNDTHDKNEETNNLDDDKIDNMINLPVNGGTIAAIHDFINFDGLEFDIEIPRHVMTIDTNFSKNDENYIRIARRYQDLLRHLDDPEDFLINDEYSKKSRIDFTSDAESGKIDISEKSKKLNSTKRPLTDLKKNPLIEKSQSNDEKTGLESNEINFDNEHSCDDINNKDYEDDNFVSIADSTKISSTSRDIEDSCPSIDLVNSESNRPKNNDESSIIVESSLKIEKIEKSVICQPVDNNSHTKIEINDAINAKNSENMEIDDSDTIKDKSNEDTSVNEKNDIFEMETEISHVTGNNNNNNSNNSMITRMEVDNDNFYQQSCEVKVNELIKTSNSTTFDSQMYNRNSNDKNEIKKRYTRLAMSQMREELNDLVSGGNHYAHDYFVLNMFSIFHSLRSSKIDRPFDLSTHQELKLPKELLPLDRNCYDTVIRDLRMFAIFPKNQVSYEKFKRNINGTDVFKRGLDAVYEFIGNEKEVGASIFQLSTQFYTILGEQLYDILSVLKRGRLILRSGVNNTRYIHQKYAEPWLIHSYKIMRLRKEALPNIAPGSLYVVSNRGRNIKTNKSEDTNEAKKINEKLRSDNNVTNRMEVNDDKSKKNTEESPSNDCETAKSSQGKMQKSRTCLLPTKDIYRAAKQLDLNTAEEIRVVVRPWIRIDGNVNRRVLDRMLGGILSYCLIHPGVHLKKVQEKFSPAIQPFHTKELVEILMRLECLKMGSARKTRVTLFSKPRSTKPVFSCIPERYEFSEEDLVIEPMLGAALKFAAFLSTKPYVTDFLA